MTAEGVETEKVTVWSSVGRYIQSLQQQFLNEAPAARGSLAELRRAVDEEPGVNPRVWAMVLECLPEYAQGRTDEASRGEWAAFTALTLYAVHQRGNSAPMHTRDVPFAQVVGKVVRDDSASLKGRYDAIITATSFAGQRHHLRSLIGLLSSKNTPEWSTAFDYGQFASDILQLQNPAKRSSVQRRWGRDFYHGYSFKPSNN
ncbi:type I-E CRISPR-associated protein Cse2/CasB [Brevibacterium sp. HMSC063G07]|uniref:type I-E CRISPR-associated protein Cse2/CasB n=1 Tax=Brevibacterium sp. HMSC063G07 TaxID=1739261 RepID=UPI0008A1E393|nr:type I-E CRISPR-associated protein Cse2/CasB [Brevibacterium sp. HMSC063G07]OFL66334.1 hypothetical protein HMPREF2757_02920 [Brevibacterium sp. HMSC063G07]